MTYTYKMFLGLDSALLLDAIANEETNEKRVPISINRTSPFTGPVADYIVIFTTKKV